MSLEQSETTELVHRDTATATGGLLMSGMRDRLSRLARLLGLPLSLYEPENGLVVADTDRRMLPVAPVDLIRQCGWSGEHRVFVSSGGLIYFAIPLTVAPEPRLVAAGYVLSKAGIRPPEMVVAAADAGWSSTQLNDWLADLKTCDSGLIERLVGMATQELHRTDERNSVGDDYARIASQLDSTYEELNLLHTLTQNMHLSRSPREVAELSLERIDAVIPAEGHAIWLDDKRDGRLFLIQGEIPFDEVEMARLIARFDGHEWPRPLVRNNVSGTLLGADFPRLRNFTLVAIADGSLRFGWILSSNLAGGDDFGSVQTSLLSSVASILGTHQNNLELYRQHEDLLLSFVRSLVSTLDAKDPYTRGHSERVALIARRLGTHLGLPEEDLRDIYLSGLLHDIGKIGIDDQILRKAGELTRDEFEQVKRHPVIGYNILAGLRNLRAILPGVRHHHESFSGTGYPDGLRGEQIPLMARIIAVADSYDAMSSDRPYRPGLKLDKLESILKDGAGFQWDPRVVAAYFAIREEVRLICDTYSPSRGTLLSDMSQQSEDLADDGDPVQIVDSIRSALGRMAGL